MKRVLSSFTFSGKRHREMLMSWTEREETKPALEGSARSGQTLGWGLAHLALGLQPQSPQLQNEVTVHTVPMGAAVARGVTAWMKTHSKMQRTRTRLMTY